MVALAPVLLQLLVFLNKEQIVLILLKLLTDNLILTQNLMQRQSVMR